VKSLLTGILFRLLPTECSFLNRLIYSVSLLTTGNLIFRLDGLIIIKSIRKIEPKNLVLRNGTMTKLNCGNALILQISKKLELYCFIEQDTDLSVASFEICTALFSPYLRHHHVVGPVFPISKVLHPLEVILTN
jgi:hypothetical protein